ncbi:MAG: DUF7507 domain-containing protein [Pirellulaceae bacterium]
METGWSDMNAWARRAWMMRWGLVAGILLASGCQHFQIPAFDPTGERIFSPSDTMQLAPPTDTRCNPSVGLFPKPAWEQALTPPPCPEALPVAPPGASVPGTSRPAVQPGPVQRGIPGKLMLSPTRLIAPVGSEVVLTGGLCGSDGFLVTGQKIEWNLSQDSAGQIVDYSDRGSYWTASKKLSADYAITTTSCRSEVVTRGTPSVTDDVVQQKGQCWISLTSANEGSSYVTAVAPGGATWPQRRQTATIYWIDCQWAFPNPVAVPAGQPHTLSTHLTRTATNAPVAGWTVRYEILDGSAVFPPGNTTSIEVRTDEGGMGTTVLQPATNLAGVTQVRIEVIRPADPDSDAPRTKMGEGYTSITWSAPGLAMRASGPPTAAVDATLVYRVEVQNPGDIVTRGVTLSDVLPPNLQFLSSNPPAQIFGDRAQWQLGDLTPKSTQVVEINVRATAGGAVRYVFKAASAEGLQTEAAVDTQIAQPALRLNVDGPPTATVGQRIQFRIEVTNTGNLAVENVTVTDRFDASLEHAEGLPNPIQKVIGRLEPGQTEQFAVGFLVRRAGQICHILEITSAGGQYAQQQVCLTASESTVPAQSRVQVIKTAPQEARVGQNVQFSTQVTNTGNVPLRNVRITDSYDPPLEPRESTPGWDSAALAAGQLVWILAQLQPGETAQRDVLCLCTREADSATSRVTVTADENISEVAQATLRILPAAPAAGGADRSAPPTSTAGQLSLEIFELGDPIRVGEATDYEIRIRNNRSVGDQNVVLKIQFPVGLRFEGLAGPVARRNVSADGRIVEVSPIREVRPGETVPSFHVAATGIQVGEHKIRVMVTSQLSPQGVVAEETTSVTAQ